MMYNPHLEMTIPYRVHDSANVACLKQNLNSNDLKDIHTKLSDIRPENLTDSGHMTELKTEVDDCKKII